MADCRQNPLLQVEQVMCRPRVANCDIPEYCTGTVCPPDSFVSNGTLCEVNPNLCGYNASCTGSSSFCPSFPSVVQPTGTLCSAAPSDCYISTYCDGITSQCLPASPALGYSCKNSLKRKIANRIFKSSNFVIEKDVKQVA